MADTDDPTKATRNVDELLEHARKRFRQSADAESALRKNMLADRVFLAGEHWPEDIRKQRERDGRPCLTIDRLTPQVKQVTNQQREMRPAIQINPVAGGADPDTAEILQGMARHIEIQSDADDAYDQAGRDQAEIGRGWIRILTDYCDDHNFDQEIKIRRVRNPFTVYSDPAAQERDYSDGLFLIVVEDLAVEDFKAKYPKAQKTGLEEFRSIGDASKDWLIGEKIRVAEYWHVEIDRTDLTVGDRTRQIETRRVVCDKITGLEVLETYAWPGKYIPWVPVLGEEIDIEGKVDLRGMVRRAKDPQRMMNFWKSATTETIALAPRAPFVAAEGQLEGHQQKWNQANTKNYSVLTYKPTAIGGQPLPPPMRQTAEPPIQALMASSQAAENDLRAATGFFDVDDRETREQSGRAIIARQQQGQHGNSDFIDGLARAVRHVGRIVIDLVPKVYDVPRVLRINGLDGQPKTVQVHAGPENAPQYAPGPDGQPMLPPGIEGVYDVAKGSYSVTVSTGPSHQSAREEFLETVGAVLDKQPQIFPYVGDLYFENMDFVGAKPIAERMKKMLPPQLQDAGPNGEPNPAAQQAQIAQMVQQMQLMGQQLQQAQQLIQGKQLELASKEKVEAAKIQSDQEIKAAELASKEKIAAIQAAVDQHKASIDAQLGVLKLQAEQSRAALQVGAAEHSQQAEHEHAREMAEKQAAASVEAHAKDKAA